MTVAQRIAIVGAGRTGKTTLALELAAHLRGRGVRAVVVDDPLRAWCERTGGAEQGSDAGLPPLAVEQLRGHALTLFMGLDLPASAAEGERRDGSDALLRRWLQDAGVSYHVVYGGGPQRLRSALHALEAAGLLPSNEDDDAHRQGGSRPWTWVCEKCSDPACEHRLFTQLQDARRG